MTLRARLLAAAAAVTLLLVLVLGGIVNRQRTILIDQIDDQVQTVARAVARSPLVALTPAPILAERRDENPPTGDIYLATIDPNGTVAVIAEPVTEPAFVPDVDQLVGLAVTVDPDDRDSLVATTVDSAGGEGQARAIVLETGTDRLLVIAQSTARIDDAQRQLLLASVLAVVAVVATLALALWWVDRLGLRPINRLTEAAEDVADGRSDRRVEHPPVSTETGRLGAAFNTMLDARQQAEDRQRRFVADASHELRTPLTTLRGYAALHRSGGLATPEAVADAMERIGTEADRMAALVEDLLTLAAIDDERPLDLAAVDIGQLVLDIGTDAAVVQPDRTVDVDGVGVGLELLGDHHLLTQAITAATSNVLRHTPPEAGLVLGVTGGAGDRIVITVADRGPGVDPEQLPFLFDRFYKADASRAAGVGAAGPSGGRGLGLAIARTVVEAHSGSIGAESAPGEGTRITIDLPLDAGSAGRRRRP